MPLHLLGKKSWNVYNTANIEKVRRDEAIEKAKEEAEEERMQEIDAARRLAILRGETPEPLPLPPSESAPEGSKSTKRQIEDAGGRGEKREKKRRKRAGEDDTDFELRIARENEQAKSKFTEEDDIPSGRQLVLRKETTRNAPVVDAQGHINLFPQDLPPISHKSKISEKEDRADQAKARKEKQIQDQISLRFNNAAGYGNSLTSKAWYESSKRNVLSHGVEEEEDEVDMIVVGKDVWGNDDPRRKEREKSRMTSNDPLAMMKAGSRKVKEVEQGRRKLREERDKEMLELRDRQLEDEERRARRKRKYGDEDVDPLEGFLLKRETEEKKAKRRKREDDERRERRDQEGHRSSKDRHRDHDRGREDREKRKERDDVGHRRDSERRHRSRERTHRTHHRD